MKYCVLVSLTHFWELSSVPSNGWIWAELLLCVFRIFSFMTQRNGQCSNLIYNQIHGCGRRVSSSCSFDHLSPSQMRQHVVIESASKDAQGHVIVSCNYWRILTQKCFFQISEYGEKINIYTTRPGLQPNLCHVYCLDIIDTWDDGFTFMETLL